MSVFCRALLFCGLIGPPLWAQEFRAFWADAWHTGFKTPQQVSQLIADLRAANCNAVVVEVRKRGDAYYNSLHEPKATDISAGFDPLQDLIDKARNTNAGPRIEIHAWMVVYPIWSSSTSPPPQPTHPYNLHPDWLGQDHNGETWASAYYVFDPGHPGVQQHTFNVAMDIVARYDVDGLNLDYIRYPGYQWGYNPAAVARFNARFGRTGQPAQKDAVWMQWRREQVTGLVRKIYLSAIAIRPSVKISADTITWAPSVVDDTGWTNSARAYTEVLQDWRSWMEEGILDINMPMAYFRQESQYAHDYLNWNWFAKDHRFDRHVVMGPGIYLNSISNSIYQMRIVRETTPQGNGAEGVCGYSYPVPASNNIPDLQATFFAALTQPSEHDAITPPIFAQPTAVPAMPWKTNPTRGHLKGTVLLGDLATPSDGALVTINGPVNRSLLTDGTGFYGFVDLPPGSYSVRAEMAGFQEATTNVTIAAGIVAHRDLALPEAFPFNNLSVTPGIRSAVITWTTPVPTTTQAEYSGGSIGLTLTPLDSRPVTRHSVLLAGLASNTRYCCQALAQASGVEHRSVTICFDTFEILALDNPEASFEGSWSTGTSSPDKYLDDYHYVSTVAGDATRTARFTPSIAIAGRYDVYIWYPQGGNRSTAAPHTIFYDGGRLDFAVNQAVNGGDWRLLATSLPFAPGTNGYLHVANNSGESGKVVLVDGARFVYAPGQDPPADMTVPSWWAQAYFGSEIIPSRDHDSDGYPTWMEYRLGTDPTAAASRLGLRADTSAGLRVIFAPFLPDRVYTLEFQPSLADGIQHGWQTLTNSTPWSLGDGVGVFLPGPQNSGQGFYRLNVAGPQ